MHAWDLEFRTERLRRWAARVLFDSPQSDVLAQDLIRAYGSLREGEPVPSHVVAALEVALVSYARPAIPVRDGEIEFPAPWADLRRSPVRDHLQAACAAVGWLRTSAVELPAPAGSAFLVSPDLILTTRHVVEPFAMGRGLHGLSLRQGVDLHIDFGDGRDSDTSTSYPVVAVTMIHPYLDLALLRLGIAPEIQPLAFWPEDPGTLEGRTVAAIAHPQFDPRFGTGLQRYVLATEPGAKRIMPGRVMQPQLFRALDKQILTLTHDAITLSGQSGSPVLDLDTGDVVGISFASAYLDANFAIPASELARDPHMWDAGLKFERKARKPDVVPWQEFWSEADPSEDTPQPAGQPYASPMSQSPPPSSSVRAAIERIVAEQFSEPAAFRTFLADHQCMEVVRAVPERADPAELLRALDRRGLLDDAFLHKLKSATAGPSSFVGAMSASPWLPQSILTRLTWAVGGVPLERMESFIDDSPWRTYLLNDGKFETASATIQRLAFDARPEIDDVLTWLLRRLRESPEVNEEERLAALQEAIDHLEGVDPAPSAETADVQLAAEPPDMRGITYLADGLEAARSVVLVQISDPAAVNVMGSTGWLLTPDLVVVPSFILLSDSAELTDERLNVELANERAKSAVVVLDFDGDRREALELEVQALVLLDLFLDLAIVRLSAPVQDRTPLRIGPDTQMPNQSGLSMIHHARLGPKQVSRDGHVLRVGENDVHYLIDTAPGSAGAPVFDADWRVIASHRASTRVRQTPAGPRIRVKLGTSMAALLSRLRDRESHRMLWREVVAAQPALKSINVNLSEHLSQSGAIPVVLELLDSEPLGPVPGFSITAQTAEIVTGLCTGTGLKELTEHPKVLSIDLSHPVGGTECATSVPHIGAHLIHHAPGGELGDKAMIALIDSGIDVLHRAFCDGQGRTRIVAFWDQHDTRSPATDIATPAAAESRAGKAMVKKFGLKYGALYLASDINRFLTGTPLPATFPPIEAMAHGTVVGGVAAGRRTGATADHFAGGVAPSARLVVVRYDLQDASIGYSKGHIDALNFIDQIADAEGLPVVVNISNGMNAGAHDGTSLLERACDMFTGLGARSGRIIIKSAGNERGQGRHASITVPQSTVKYLRWRSRNYFGLAPSTSTEELEIWFNHLNQYQFRLRTPSGHWSPTINAQNSTLVEYLGNRNFASILLKPYHPDNGSGSLNIKISPGEQQGVEEEEWQLEITGVLVPQREPLHAWIEQIANRNVFFQDYLDDRYTVTIPGTANHVISVGAVAVSQLMTPYERSSWGPTRKGVEKPELVAPGVNLFGPGANLTDRRSQRPESGTSVAAPHLAGAIALALSLCVKSGRAPHTSMRVRSALQETARYGTRTWNEETGYGELDAEAMYRNLLGP